MKVRYEMIHFGFDPEPHYIKKIKEHWWSRWLIVMDGQHPLLFRKVGNSFLPF